MLLIEELSANAWPGLKHAYVDGWVVRFAEGYSGRANSVLPFYPGTGDVSGRIDQCEQLFRQEGLNPAFKLFSGAQPEGLDQDLDRRGYQKQSATTVMVLEDLCRPALEVPTGYTLDVQSRIHEPWFQVYAAQNGTGRPNIQAAWKIMSAIVPETRYLLLNSVEGPAACALVVIERGWVGLFDVVVRQDLRGQGLGRCIVELALAEGRRLGAQQSYLQVMDSNTVAVSLYRSMGYRVSYPYWYRVKEQPR